MVVNSIYKTQQSFSNTIKSEYGSSVDIENVSNRYLYVNKDLKQYTSTTNKIRLYENILLTKYYNKIKQSCRRKTLTKEEKIRYKYRPEMLSVDEYSTTTLWYLILYVNSCEDFSEFSDIDTVLLTDISVINSCILNEEFIIKQNNK